MAIRELVDAVARVRIKLDELSEIVDLVYQLLHTDVHFIVGDVLENTANSDRIKSFDVSWFSQEEIAVYFALVDIELLINLVFILFFGGLLLLGLNFHGVFSLVFWIILILFFILLLIFRGRL